MSSGVAICCTAPSRSTAMRSAMLIASTWSCVTYTSVRLRSRWRYLSSLRISRRSSAASAETGPAHRERRGLAVEQRLDLQDLRGALHALGDLRLGQLLLLEREGEVPEHGLVGVE